MDTKQKGDIAEQAVILKALKFGWGVLRPIGDRMPYDLVFDVKDTLARIQVKCAWFDSRVKSYVVDTRRTKTNRRIMIRDRYSDKDFDFAVIYLPETDIFYIFPISIFINYRSTIFMVEAVKRQRVPQSAIYRDAWNLILQWAAPRGNSGVNLVKFGETPSGGNPEPRSKTKLDKV